MSDEAVVDTPEFLKAQIGQLSEQIVQLKDELVNRDLTDFADIVTAETREFWSGQLQANRTGAMAALNAIRARNDGAEQPAKDAPPPPAAGGDAPARPRPMHNRATTRPIPAAIVSGVDKPEANAVKIRNRAHAISKAEGIPFSAAFRRAEGELGEVH